MHSKPYKNGSEQTSHLLQSATVWALKAGFGARQLGSWAAGQPVSLESLTFLDFFPDFTLHAFKAHNKEDQFYVLGALKNVSEQRSHSIYKVRLFGR